MVLQVFLGVFFFLKKKLPPSPSAFHILHICMLFNHGTFVVVDMWMNRQAVSFCNMVVIQGNLHGLTMAHSL